jgi:hypothetical protein
MYEITVTQQNHMEVCKGGDSKFTFDLRMMDYENHSYVVPVFRKPVIPQPGEKTKPFHTMGARECQNMVDALYRGGYRATTIETPKAVVDKYKQPFEKILAWILTPKKRRISKTELITELLPCHPAKYRVKK